MKNILLILFFLCSIISYAQYTSGDRPIQDNNGYLIYDDNGDVIQEDYRPYLESIFYDWWHASTGVTLNGSKVSNWASYNGRNFVQATTNNQPTLVNSYLNGLDAIYFSGSPVQMALASNLTLNVPFYMLIVIKDVYNTASFGYILSNPTTNLGILASGSPGITGWWYTSVEGLNITSNTVFKIESGIYKSGTNNFKLYNGTSLAGSATEDAGNGMLRYMGYYPSANYSKFYITDICIWYDTPSTAQLTTRVQYFKNLYGL